MVKINDFLVLLFVVATVQIAKTFADEKCEKDWAKDATTGYCYYFSTDLSSQRLAMIICAKMGSYLASAKTRREHSFLVQQLIDRRSNCKQNENCNDFWIGLHRFQDKWKFMDGTKAPVDLWYPDYPVAGGGDCALTAIADNSEGYGGAWQNENCHKTHRFVCKSFCPAGFYYSEVSNKCYRIISEKLSWEEAWEKCPEINPDANLVIFASEIEAETAVDYIKTQTKKNPLFCADARRKAIFWVGAKRSESSNGCHFPISWRSSPKVGTEIPLTYANWNRNEPHCLKGDGVRTCVQIEQAHDFKWSSKDCEAIRCALCEVNPGHLRLNYL